VSAGAVAAVWARAAPAHPICATATAIKDFLNIELPLGLMVVDRKDATFRGV
jgi:hypothetical protein